MKGYVEIRKNVNNHIGIVPIQDYQQVLTAQYKTAPESDWYRSLFVYKNGIVEHVKNNGGVGGYTGEVDAGYLFFDLDSKDLDQARKDTIKIIKRIIEETKIDNKVILDCLNIYFSGNKGFHLFLYTTQRFNPEDMKSVCSRIAEDIPSFDSKIYNTTRIIRIENTLHQKSKKYKIAITPEQLKKPIEEIVKLAETKSNYNHKPSRLDFKWKINNPETKIQSNKITEYEDISGLETIDFSRCPRNVPRCVYALAQGIMVPGQGERHHIFRALARFYRNQGMNADQVHNQLKATARLNSKFYPEAESYERERIWHECVKDLFEGKDKFFNKGGWGIDPEKDDIFKKYCSSIEKYANKPCCMHNSNNKKKFYSVEDLVTNYRKFAKDFDKSIVKTGIDFIDRELEIRRRTVTLLVGSAGSGKTTVALKILENSNRLGIHSVFFCMDMDMFSIYEKLAAKHTSYSRKEIRNAIKKLENAQELSKNEEIIIQETEKSIKEYYKHTTFDFSSTLTMEQMKERVLELEDSSGNKIGMVLVDYAGRISSDHKDSYANDKHNALKSKEVAQISDAAWIFLCQTSRNSGDSFIPLRTKRAAKGAGDWEEAAQNVLTMWRPFAGVDGVLAEDGSEFRDNYMRVYLAKNRLGKERETLLFWAPEKGILEEMSDVNMEIYRDDIEPLEKMALKYRQGKRFGD